MFKNSAEVLFLYKKTFRNILMFRNICFYLNLNNKFALMLIVGSVC